jgi:hypothetical protein
VEYPLTLDISAAMSDIAGKETYALFGVLVHSVGRDAPGVPAWRMHR